MTALPFAFISSVGEDAGIATIIGLVILAALHFVQARETTRIGQKLERAVARIPELEQQAARLVPQADRNPGGVGPTRTGSASTSRSAKRPSESRPVRGSVVLLTVVAAAVAVGAVILIAGAGGKTAGTPGGPVRGVHTRTVPVYASSVTVTVLNGTSMTGLAHRISLRLAHAGFKLGKVTNTASRTQTTTLVGYAPRHEIDALAVAQVLKLASNTVRPITAGGEAIACSPARMCTSAKVVVTVGSDLAAQ